MLLVQTYLETHTFGDLVRDHGVYASFSKSGHKFSLNYDQIEAKESDPLSQETRGLILAAEDGRSFTSQAQQVNGRNNYDHISPGKTKIVAYPMRRFFNHGQGSAAEINWSDPQLAVLEKLDGTLCIVYYDFFTKKWCVATRSVPEADLLMDNGIYTFRTLFEKALQTVQANQVHYDSFESFADGHLSKNFTYCFELTTPYNRIVVNYPNNGVTLLAARHMPNLNELDLNHEQLRPLSNIIPFVQSYAPTSMTELVDWVSSLNPMEHEGVVVRDSNFNRIKVKNAAYVAYNKVRDALATSPRNIVELILSEKDDDVVPFLPEEIVKNLQNIKVGVQAVIKEYDIAYQSAKSEADKILPGDKKTFAILVTKNKDLWGAPFFQMFEGKAENMKGFIANSRKDGSWGNGFLDKMLELSKKH